MTKLFLITGFLGAGKTSFLQHTLKQTSIKTGVLMNEFGKESIDGITIASKDINMVQLTNGSIFCSCLKTHFIEGLISLINQNLDYIFIESSGLADPSDMGNVLNVVKKSTNTNFDYQGTICLIDGVYFEKELATMVNVERQIKHSHIILINKTDLINPSKLNDIQNKIISINDRAKIYNVKFGQIDLKTLENHTFHIDEEETTNQEDKRPTTVVLKFKEEPTKETLTHCLKELTPYFFRIKGYIMINNTNFKVDVVNDSIEVISVSDVCSKNELIFLASTGITSISKLVKLANKHFPGLFELEV